MKRPTRSSSHGILKLVSLTLCYSLIATTTMVPSSNARELHLPVNSGLKAQPGWLGLPARVLGFLNVLQGGGGLPSLPGPNLPDLDAARQTLVNEPEALPPIASEQSCEDCAPCPDCVINHKPVARHGGPYFGSATQSIQFSGLGSFDPDPDDEISDYIWTFGDSSPAVEVHGATPTHTYASAGVYTVTLRVKDLNNLFSDATATSTTVNAAPTPTPTPAASPSPSPSPTPAQTNAATFVSQSVPSTMTAGERYPVAVTIRNTGDTTWTAAHLYRLGSQSPQDNSVWGRARVYLSTTVAPGAVVTFNFTVLAPYAGSEETPPPTAFQWRMVQDGVGYFGDVTPNLSVAITSNYQPPNPGLAEVGPFSNLFMSRIATQHRTGGTGEDLLSGNYNWGMSLLSLAGRAGLDLNLGLSYNSLAAWSRVDPPDQPLLPAKLQQPTWWKFDPDSSFPSVGFRLGFPSIQGPFTNVQTGSSAYLLLLTSGARVELRQSGSANVYESTDSSYLQLVDGGNGGLLLRTTDGNQLAYLLIGGEYRCTELRDRNGNYVTVKYDSLNGQANPGRMTSIIDTLGRTIMFSYDQNYRLLSIAQLRSGQSPQVWATFGYSNREVLPNFAAVIDPGTGELNSEVGSEEGGQIVGLPNSTVSLLTQVGLADGSHYNFDYTSWGQVWRTHHYAADGHELSYTSYNLPQDSDDPQMDCPRFTQRQDWTENFNNGAPVTTTFEIDHNGEGQWGKVTLPDGTAYKEFFTADYTAWQRGLVTRTETYSPDSATPKKISITDWTQENLTIHYPLNPRVTATTISDSDGNRRRTTIDYDSFSLPADVYEWGPVGASGWSLLRRTHTDYELSAAYVNQRLIGLAKQRFLFGPEDNGQRLYSKTSYEYDAGGSEFLQNQGNPAQHDANYGTTALVRGNVTKALRWDVNYENDISHATASTMGYNTCGSTVFSRDALAHQTTISYADAFSTNGTDATNPPAGGTFAYPTTVTDADGFSSNAKYNYDLGAVTRTQDPKGVAQITEYDSAGRVKRITNTVNGAYTRFLYPTSQTIINKFTTINDLATETYTATVLDGGGRVRAIAGDFPGSVGHYTGQYTLYDQMGRAIQQTNATEMNHAWAAAGDDAAGWHSSSQTFDWKGRALITTNPDGTTKEASYGGCGCAGGEVVTLTDEGTIDGGVPKRRQQRSYSDALGRTVKTEVLNWQGGSPYSTTVNSYNARDQIKSVRQYQGAEASAVYQETTMSYDGYGRQRTKHIPQQETGTATVWEYNADDTVQKVTDARGSITSYSYNARHLIIGISYDPSAGVTDTSDVVLGYDTAGNRTSMTDGLGSVSYQYSQLSQLTSETRTFNGIGTFQIGYDYNLVGQLKKLTDSTNMSIDYSYDSVGRLSGVTGSDNLYNNVSNYASNFQYRASGGLKAMTDGKGYVSSLLYNAKLQPTHFAISGNLVSQDYEYNSDGRISVVHNNTDQNFDRSYAYDQLGRLTEAKTGADVNGHQYNAIPYHETFGYDGFSNLTARQSQSWNGQTDNTDTASYTNNRRGGWGYDADGRNTTIDTRSYTFDAAGNQTAMNATAIASNGSSYTVNKASTFDGDGAKAKELDTQSNAPGYANTTFYLRSSVLGGAIIEEINSSGQKNVGYVYSPAGQLLATQQPNIPNSMVTWKHRAPAGTGEYSVNTYNTATGRTELDPLGANISLTAPAELPPTEGQGDIGAGHFGGIMDSRWSDFFNLSSGCTKRGVAASCSEAMDSLNAASLTGQQVGSLRFSMPAWAWEELGKQPWRKQVAVISGRELFEPTLEDSALSQEQKNARNLLGECSVHALLDTLGYSEGATYDTVVMGTVIKAPGHAGLVGKTNVKVPDFSEHPNILVQVRPGLNSTAAGRYQFLNRTWTGLGLPNFSEFNQDVGAVMLMERRGMIVPLLNGDVEQAIVNGNAEWASFPGSPYGQGTRSMSSLKKVYERSLLNCTHAMHEILQGLPINNV